MALTISDLVNYVQSSFPTLPVNATWFNTEFGKIKTSINSIVSVLKDFYPSLTFGGTGGLSSASVATPATTSTGTMMGLGWSYKPTKTGNVLLLARFEGIENNNINCFTTLQFGTGTAPANGAALTGTETAIMFNIVGPANQVFPCAPNALLTGLTVGTTYWFDFAAWIASGTTSVTIDVFNLNFTFIEL